MSEKQKEFSNIFRLYNLSLAISGLVATLIMALYAGLFSFIGFSSLSTVEGSTRSSQEVGVVFLILFGGAALVALLFTVVHGIVAWQFNQPRKWVWILAVIGQILQVLNIYYLPLTIYFLIQLFKEEYKIYFTQ